MKKVFTVVLVGIFLVSLVGCGALRDGNDNAGKTTNSIQSTQGVDNPTNTAGLSQNTTNGSTNIKSTQPVQNSKSTDEISKQFNDLDFDESLDSNDQVTEQDLDIPNP